VRKSIKEKELSPKRRAKSATGKQEGKRRGHRITQNPGYWKWKKVHENLE
jgi:hypothetical protein